MDLPPEELEQQPELQASNKIDTEGLGIDQELSNPQYGSQFHKRKRFLKQIQASLKWFSFKEVWDLCLVGIDVYLSQEGRLFSDMDHLADAVLRFSRILPYSEESSRNFSSSNLISRFVQFLGNESSEGSEVDKTKVL